MFGQINHRRSRSAAFLILALALSACSAVQPISTPADTSANDASVAPSAPVVEAPATSEAQPTTSPSASASAAAGGTSATDPEQIKAGIQKTLDLYAEAYNENKPELFTQIVDQRNGPMKRYAQSRFEIYQGSMFGGQGGYEFTVNDVEQRENGFVMAEVRQGNGVAHWTFREVDGRWVMSEPNEQQLGERQKVETEHFTFYMYPWTSEINDTLMKQMEIARSQVLERLGKVPDKKASVYIKPTFGVGETTGPTTLAFYNRNSRNNDRIVIAAPQSYVFPFYNADTGWEPELQTTLTHEYAHLVNNRSFTPISRMTDWMVEGLAEYVSDPTSARSRGVPQAVASGQIIPIIDTSSRVNKQDLEHLTILEQDVGLAYGFAFTLVEFVNERHGGMEGFWKLTEAFDKTQKLDTALQQAFGIGFEQFDREWREWLSEKYGS